MKVVIRNAQGQYLGMTKGKVTFVGDKSRAIAYDFEKDRVEEQLAVVKRTNGVTWIYEEVPPGEAVDDLPRTTLD